ncbi:MAG: MATE family efflux transporter [Legionellales bacterium]|nr:MATE family efflux transporter [Legionellales bacterium]
MKNNHKNHVDLSYHANSPWKIFKIAAPLMLTELSTSLMLVLDRLILSNYSYHAMNAAISASASIMVCQYGFLSLTTIATIFAGNHNGARKFHKVPEPIWQMIWFSITSSIIFIALGNFAGKILINPNFYDDGLQYYRIIMSFGFLISLIGAISSFFIATGKTKIITYSVICANIINLILDIILVFGISNIINPMGTKGAAIATVIGQFIQALLLLLIFLNKNNRKAYRTHYCKIKLKILFECINIGLPVSISHLIEFTSWAFVIYMIGSLGDSYMLVFSIGNTLFYLYLFALDGMQKTTSSIASNLLGSEKHHLIKRLISSSIKMHFVIAFFLMIPSVIFPDLFIRAFSLIHEEKIDMSLLQAIHTSLLFVWIYFIIDGITWIIASILTAFRDTFIPMILNGMTSWLISVLPIYIFVVKNNGAPELMQIIPCFYTSLLAISYYLRLRTHIK